MLKILSLLLSAFFLTACSEVPQQQVTEEKLRSVKLFTVLNSDRAENRVLIGKVTASETAELSFPLSGKVISIAVEKGDPVKTGQQVAKLDNTDLLAIRKAAQASLNQAKAQFENKKVDFDRKKALVDRGLITRSEMDAAQAEMLSAQAQLDIAQVDLRDANKHLNDTVLKSPFNGIVSERLIEPHTEVTTGQPILSLEAEGQNYEVEFGVPEMIMSSVTRDMPVSVKLGKNPVILTGKITEIAPTASVGNVFKVKATLDETEQNIKSGLAAEVTLSISNEQSMPGVLIPVTAVMATLDQQMFVYVYQPDTQLLEKRAVEKANQVIGNQVAVQGINAGEQIVSAGVAFVTDGLKVTPYIDEQ